MIAYKLYADSTILLIKKSGDASQPLEINSKNKMGVYNYLFKDCITKDSSVIKRKAINDYILTKDITKDLNCHKSSYITYKDYGKTYIYLGLSGGISLQKETVKFVGETPAPSNSKNKASVGYHAGILFLINVNKKFDVITTIDYSSNTTTYSYDKVSTYPFTYTDNFSGTRTIKAVNAHIDFRYRILKTKASPYLLAGILFSKKIKNEQMSSYIHNGTPSTITNYETLSPFALGLDIGAGVTYNPINRLSLHTGIGYTYGVGVFGPNSYRVKESNIYADLGIAIRLNK